MVPVLGFIPLKAYFQDTFFSPQAGVRGCLLFLSRGLKT